MATMNHTNLTTYNVAGLTEFFCSVFGFQVIDKRADKLAVLRNSDGFLLTLMYDKLMTPEQGYPGLFHVGLLQPTQHAVDLMHEDLRARNYMAPKPTKLQRGGPETYGFYYEAPGGVLVEVSTMNITETALQQRTAKRVRICVLTRHAAPTVTSLRGWCVVIFSRLADSSLLRGTFHLDSLIAVTEDLGTNENGQSVEARPWAQVRLVALPAI